MRYKITRELWAFGGEWELEAGRKAIFQLWQTLAGLWALGRSLAGSFLYDYALGELQHGPENQQGDKATHVGELPPDLSGIISKKRSGAEEGLAIRTSMRRRTYMTMRWRVH